MPSIQRLVYVSRATAPFSDAELRALGKQCTENNAPWNVTGLLLYSAGHFMQCLEGDRVTILRIYDRICADTRHREIRRLFLESTDTRLFPSWWMGLLNLDHRDAPLDGPHLLNALANATTTTDGHCTTDALQLFKYFRNQLPAGDAKPSAA